MATKKDKISLAQSTGVLPEKKCNSLGEGKSIYDVIKEQGLKPIKNEDDFERIFGGYKEWFDVDEFLKEAHGTRG